MKSMMHKLAIRVAAVPHFFLLYIPYLGNKKVKVAEGMGRVAK
jgi:hypothetical protein